MTFVIRAYYFDGRQTTEKRIFAGSPFEATEALGKLCTGDSRNPRFITVSRES